MKTNAYSSFLSIIGRIQEGIRELDVLKDKRDVNICSTMALMFAHKHSQSVGEFSPKLLQHIHLNIFY